MGLFIHIFTSHSFKIDTLNNKIIIIKVLILKFIEAILLSQFFYGEEIFPSRDQILNNFTSFFDRTFTLILKHKE